MNEDISTSQMTRSEQETETEGNRLIEQVESALAIVAVRSSDEVDSLEAVADRIERAARDLADALRELSRERRASAAGT
ncbi:MAG TPA: hypothetical protein VI750_10265 [Pyrinomonadaceae bacterium]|nr:hypothetical protein [Pyrinomonadaceae bacterium]